MQISDDRKTVVFDGGIFAPHVHIRQEGLMKDVIHFSDPYAYITAMGNTTPLIKTANDALRYKKKALKHKPKAKLIMTIMMTKDTTVKTIRGAYRAGIKVVKYIPTGTSTGATNDGVRLVDLLRTKSDVLAEIERLGMIFSGHWELIESPITEKTITWWKREERAIPYLKKVIKKFPTLKIIVEHASTRKIIELVKNSRVGVFATLTLHHALYTKEQAFYANGKIKDPFLFCLPSLKTNDDRLAVIQTMISGNPKFFFGPDCAPHYEEKKRSKNPPAGICTPAKIAIPLLVQTFEEIGKLSLLQLFALDYGSRVYGIKIDRSKKTIVKRKFWKVENSYNNIVTLMSGQALCYQLQE